MCLSVLVWVLMINMFVHSLWISFKASKLSLAYAVMHMFGCLSMCLRLIFVFAVMVVGWWEAYVLDRSIDISQHKYVHVSKTPPAHSVGRVTM